MQAVIANPAPDDPPQVILVVDDEVLVRLAVAEFLRDCGFQVFEAADGTEAILILEATDRPIDLIFSDVQMPNLDGFGLAKWVREHRSDVKIVLTSGNPAHVAAKAADLCHEGPIIAKPYEHAHLLQQIQKMLSRAKNAAA
jgi:CheY-like chemotaxis protein